MQALVIGGLPVDRVAIQCSICKGVDTEPELGWLYKVLSTGRDPVASKRANAVRGVRMRTRDIQVRD